ncbi:MAG: hypothetical protein HYX78_12230 [Armatimonadetes bacterium]|nr:hypothetical protein [Armatimonadota bacterium]
MRFFLALLLCLFVTAGAMAAAPTTLDDFFLPGSQPGESGTLEDPGRCFNCHSNYDQAVEPGSNWSGSMMAQAARDPLFYACLAVANQDAPDVGDLCLRCHTPAGWLGGRSVPTDGSALTAQDREGVMCDFCHRSVKPSPVGVNPFPGDLFYTQNTYSADQIYLSKISSHIPPTEANGMYVVDSDSAKRGPFSDPAARHQWRYSAFHRTANMCGTCHDVSNPVFDRQPDGTYVSNTFGQARTDFDPYSMFPIERTFSEWKMSAFNDGSEEHTCQGCHMPDVTGKGCNKADAPVRSNLPLHNMTGGNTWIPDIIAQFFPGEVDPALLSRGKTRAANTLRRAAFLESHIEGGDLVVKVTNLTGHKLPSGYPEGRRIWVNVKFRDASGALVSESGIYGLKSDTVAHTFGFGQFSPGQQETLLVPTVLDHDMGKVYEIKPGLSESLAAALGLPAGPSFHFVLNDTVYFDNRIPPAGFTNAGFRAIQSPPIAYNYADGQNWDDTRYAIPTGAVSAEIALYYQTASYEYIKFLLEENRTNNWGERLFDAWRNSGFSTPVAMVEASISLPTVAENIASAKSLPDGAEISLPGRTVTAALSGRFYVEESNRSCGIAVSWADEIEEGSAAAVVGTLTTVDGEREIVASSVLPASVEPVEPVHMTCFALGGGTSTGRPGPDGGMGVNNVGLLVRVAGTAGQRAPDGFLLDDGSKVYVEVVAPGLTLPSEGSKVVVTGISGLGTRNSKLSRLVRVRKQEDIRISN